MIKIKYRLTAIAAMAILGLTTTYAGPIDDILVEIGPSAVQGLYVLDVNANNNNDFQAVRPFSTITHAKAPTTTSDKQMANGRILETTTETKTKTTTVSAEQTGFKIIGNHETGSFWSSAQNKQTGKVVTKIGKNEADFCLITVTFDETSKPTNIASDCTGAKDFEFGSYASEGRTYHLYFTPKSV